MPILDRASIIDAMPRVQKLVHLAARLDIQDSKEISKLNQEQKRNAYESELNTLIRQVGCKRTAVVSSSAQALIDAQSDAEADSIVNTYNYFLAVEIRNIRIAFPKSNRHVFASKLRAWHNKYMQYKSSQIALHNEVEWRAHAQSQFLRYNKLEGIAELEPKSHAQCDVCKMWIARGSMPLREARKVMAKWPPHVNCIHTWKVNIGKAEDCAKLWIG